MKSQMSARCSTDGDKGVKNTQTETISEAGSVSRVDDSLESMSKSSLKPSRSPHISQGKDRHVRKLTESPQAMTTEDGGSQKVKARVASRTITNAVPSPKCKSSPSSKSQGSSAKKGGKKKVVKKKSSKKVDHDVAQSLLNLHNSHSSAEEDNSIADGSHSNESGKQHENSFQEDTNRMLLVQQAALGPMMGRFSGPTASQGFTRIMPQNEVTNAPVVAAAAVSTKAKKKSSKKANINTQATADETGSTASNSFERNAGQPDDEATWYEQQRQLRQIQEMQARGHRRSSSSQQGLGLAPPQQPQMMFPGGVQMMPPGGMQMMQGGMPIIHQGVAQIMQGGNVIRQGGGGAHMIQQRGAAHMIRQRGPQIIQQGGMTYAVNMNQQNSSAGDGGMFAQMRQDGSSQVQPGVDGFSRELQHQIRAGMSHSQMSNGQGQVVVMGGAGSFRHQRSPSGNILMGGMPFGGGQQRSPNGQMVIQGGFPQNPSASLDTGDFPFGGQQQQQDTRTPSGQILVQCATMNGMPVYQLVPANPMNQVYQVPGGGGIMIQQQGGPMSQVQHFDPTGHSQGVQNAAAVMLDQHSSDNSSRQRQRDAGNLPDNFGGEQEDNIEANEVGSKKPERMIGHVAVGKGSRKEGADGAPVKNKKKKVKREREEKDEAAPEKKSRKGEKNTKEKKAPIKKEAKVAAKQQNVEELDSDDEEDPDNPDNMQTFTAEQQAKWEEMFKRLVLFKAMHGHTRVPETFEDARLVNWVGNQRKAMSRQQRGLPFGRFDQSRIDMLNSIGFEWARSRASENSSYIRRSWEDMFQNLCTFKEKHGHTRVLASVDSRLANWVRNQRTAMSRKQRGLPYRCLNERRIALLDSVGFAWVASKDNEGKQEGDSDEGGDDDDSNEAED